MSEKKLANVNALLFRATAPDAIPTRVWDDIGLHVNRKPALKTAQVLPLTTDHPSQEQIVSAEAAQTKLPHTSWLQSPVLSLLSYMGGMSYWATWELQLAPLYCTLHLYKYVKYVQTFLLPAQPEWLQHADGVIQGLSHLVIKFINS